MFFFIKWVFLRQTDLQHSWGAYWLSTIITWYAYGSMYREGWLDNPQLHFWFSAVAVVFNFCFLVRELTAALASVRNQYNVFLWHDSVNIPENLLPEAHKVFDREINASVHLYGLLLGCVGLLLAFPVIWIMQFSLWVQIPVAIGALVAYHRLPINKKA